MVWLQVSDPLSPAPWPLGTVHRTHVPRDGHTTIVFSFTFTTSTIFVHNAQFDTNHATHPHPQSDAGGGTVFNSYDMIGGCAAPTPASRNSM